MQNVPNGHERQIEAIELARRSRMEPSDPAMGRLDDILVKHPKLAELCEQSRLADDRLRSAMRDVPLPQGMEQRILDRLALSRASRSLPALEPPLRMPEHFAKKRTLRRWQIGISAGFLAMSLLVAMTLCYWNSNRLTLAQLVEEAAARFTLNGEMTGEYLINQAPPSHPFSRDVICPRDTRWRAVDHFLGRQGVAYEMATPAGDRATLFVVPCSHCVDGLDFFPPRNPQQATGGIAVAAWQADNFVYLLVVQGDHRTYRQFLNAARPFAMTELPCPSVI